MADPVDGGRAARGRAVEGSALGWAQAHVLADMVPGLRRGAFVVATAAGAVAAYAIGLIPATAGESLSRWPTALLVALAAVGGTALLATIGTAQWLVLRRVRAGSAWWIAATGGAWAAGLLVFLAVAPPLWQPGQPLPLLIAIGVTGGLAMAATVAALTGLAAGRLAAPATGPARPGLSAVPPAVPMQHRQPEAGTTPGEPTFGR